MFVSDCLSVSMSGAREWRRCDETACCFHEHSGHDVFSEDRQDLANDLSDHLRLQDSVTQRLETRVWPRSSGSHQSQPQTVEGKCCIVLITLPLLNIIL